MICLPKVNRAGIVSTLDTSGASASILCALHCALTPMVLTLLPAIGLGILADEGVEIALMSLSAMLGMVSLTLSFRAHRSPKALGILVVGLCLLALGRITEEGNHEPIGIPLVVGGGLVVAASHLVNRRLCRSCLAQAVSPGGELDLVQLSIGPKGSLGTRVEASDQRTSS